jgi:Mg2+ and Co2+ transporter CorA
MNYAERQFEIEAEECMKDESQIDQDILSMDQEDMVNEIMTLRKALDQARRVLNEVLEEAKAAKALIVRCQSGVKKD